MTREAWEAYRFALEARRNAHHARRRKGPGWRLYFKAEMTRAIRKWRQFAEDMRAS